MPNKMIIDASHPEETRVVVLKGDRVDEFDFESVSKKPLRGNIYLAKVTRVEPSLQAAFIDYGGNRHGFLAFSEIHPDYYQIPIADRRALLEEEAQSHRDEDEDVRDERRSRRRHRGHGHAQRARDNGDETVSAAPGALDDERPRDNADILAPDLNAPELPPTEEDVQPALVHFDAPADIPAEAQVDVEPTLEAAPDVAETDAGPAETGMRPVEDGVVVEAPARSEEDEIEPVEHIGGDAMDEAPRRAPRLRRHYKIQEVIKRRQVLLVQVVKEERGNKGAALTTYLSLAGRYSVLMPNTARGGGISRKITSAQDRDRLREIAEELEVPEGMGVILRTAGAARTKPEIKRDFEYLMRMWETVRETTLASTAPTLVYEEGSLIKRAIRDLYGRDVDEIVVAGDEGYREARDFMKLLMPTHADSVKLYRETQPIFARSGVEAQLDAMFSNQVTLKSGGYIVINQTEALVAIDVNSGRSTREHNIEDTALRTNLEAADEIARQLRLRDLAGLIVVDFIDMEEMRNNRSVERRMKDALKNDRARIQVGRISHFGLLEMSRQRIRSGVIEGSTVQCPHCLGAGVVRSTSSMALHVLRVIEDALIRDAARDVTLRTRTAVALYILNQKRAHLRDLEERFGVAVSIEADDSLVGATTHAIERGEATQPAREAPRAAPQAFAPETMADEEFEEEEGEAETAETESGTESSGGAGENGEAGRRRRRRRRRRGGEREGFERDAAPRRAEGAAEGGEESEAESEDEGEEPEAAPEGERQDRPRESNGEGRRGRRRRGRRGRFGGRDYERNGEFAAPARVASDDSEPPVEATLEPAPPRTDDEVGARLVAAYDDAPRASAPVEESRPASPRAVAVEPAPEPAPVDETPRPRRSGWWQKAKMSLIGD